MSNHQTVEVSFWNSAPGRFLGESGIRMKTTLQFLDLQGQLAKLERKYSQTLEMRHEAARARSESKGFRLLFLEFRHYRLAKQEQRLLEKAYTAICRHLQKHPHGTQLKVSGLSGSEPFRDVCHEHEARALRLKFGSSRRFYFHTLPAALA